MPSPFFNSARQQHSDHPQQYSIKLNNNMILMDNLTASELLAINSRFFEMLQERGHMDNLLSAGLGGEISAFWDFLENNLGRTITTESDLRVAIRHTIESGVAPTENLQSMMRATINIEALMQDIQSAEMEGSYPQNNP